MARIALVACSSSKRAVNRAAAGDMYTSPLFQKSRTWAVRNCDRWYILSAKYGLLHPEQTIEHYNVTLNDMYADARKGWSREVLEAILMQTNPGDELVFLAGKNYRHYLESPLKQRGYQIHIPLEGLRIGQQLQWLDQHTHGT